MGKPSSDSEEITALRARLDAEPAVLVTLTGGAGSLPREAGAWMAVFADGQIGSIGGGQLEWQACRHARGLLRQPDPIAPESRRWSLGARLGQCCGGVADVRFEALDASGVEPLWQSVQQHRTPVALFGAGHVGQSLVRALLPLPFALHWVDSRDGVFAPDLPRWVSTEQSDPVQQAVWALAPGSLVLVMSFSHAEDFDIVSCALKRWRERADLPFIGLIGSRSKWASFRRRLLQRGHGADELDRVRCPIGLPGIVGKQPAVIAASVAAQLLQMRGDAGA